MTRDDTITATAPSATASAAVRHLRIHVLRYNPQRPDAAPHVQIYPIEEAAGMTLFIALNEIREKQDPSLQFDFVCRAGICGSCAMVIDGRPTLACRTLTKNLGAEITLAPVVAGASLRVASFIFRSRSVRRSVRQSVRRCARCSRGIAPAA